MTTWLTLKTFSLEWTVSYTCIHTRAHSTPTISDMFSFLNLSTTPESCASEILVLLGEELITTCCVGVIERSFRCLGANLHEFLGALEGVHDVLKLQEDGCTDTDFICADEGELIFTTDRPVIAWLLLGSLKALTRILYNINASITIEPIENDPKCYRYLFALPDEERVKSVPVEAVTPLTKSTATDLKMNPATFCKAFPWHLIMDEQLDIVQMGKGFSKIFQNSFQTDNRSVTTYFHFKRPTILTIKFREIMRRSNTPFMLAVKSVAGFPNASEVSVHTARVVLFAQLAKSLRKLYVFKSLTVFNE